MIILWESSVLDLWHDLDVQTWMYIAVPVLLYCGERTLRAFRAGNYTVNIVKVMRFLFKFAIFFVSPVSWNPFQVQSTYLPYSFRRRQFIAETSWLCICQNLQASSTRAECICFSSVPRSRHSNGKFRIYVRIYKIVWSYRVSSTTVTFFSNFLHTGTHSRSPLLQMMNTLAWISEQLETGHRRWKEFSLRWWLL